MTNSKKYLRLWEPPTQMFQIIFLNITKDFPGLADLPNWKAETFD